MYVLAIDTQCSMPGKKRHDEETVPASSGTLGVEWDRKELCVSDQKQNSMNGRHALKAHNASQQRSSQHLLSSHCINHPSAYEHYRQCTPKRNCARSHYMTKDFVNKNSMRQWTSESFSSSVYLNRTH